jgi:hypothetical protein
VAVFFLLPIGVAFRSWERDPFDKFEVIGIEAERDARRFAVTYRYHHANSSEDMFAIWALSDPPPMGSRAPPPGGAAPVLVWTNRADIADLRWDNGMLQATATKAIDRRRGNMSDCYFAEESRPARPPVCYDPRAVQIVDGEMR